ncbi:MAG: PEP-CTERM sorting domain-containing protein [Gammaproteobacteria bacterium]|nr:PEP-CTERM sorting domain-containing protein [Gammaproteobacteria bacterium]
MGIPKIVANRLVFATILLSISFAAQSALIRVSQESTAGAGDFDANVLGLIESFSFPGLSIADFYDYGTPAGASYNGDLNGGPTPVSSMTQGFFVEASDGLHYVVVHDNPSDGSGGSTEMTDLLVGGAGGSAGFSVLDDPSETGTVTDLAGDRKFETSHNWVSCCTDGYAIGDLGPSFLMFAMFDMVPTGINAWQATSSTPGENIALALVSGREVRFDLNPIPVPAAIWLFGTALVGFVGMSRRRKMS